MKKILLLFVGLSVSLFSLAAEKKAAAKQETVTQDKKEEAAAYSDNRRGEVFEHEGVIYTISSLYNKVESGHWKEVKDSTKKGITYKWEGLNGLFCNRYGEVLISGVSTQNVDLNIKPTFITKTDYDSKKPELIQFTVIGIADKAFEGVSLNSLTLPFGMKYVGKEAFKDMTITDPAGTFFFPNEKRVMADAFDGLKARLFLLNTEECVFDKTFRNIDLLPEIFVHHDYAGKAIQGLDRRYIYSVGNEYKTKWAPSKNVEEYTKTKSRNNGVIPESMFCNGNVTYLGDKIRFKTLGENTTSPTFNIRKTKKFNKTNTCLDIFSPYEYSCYNPYTSQQDVYSEFVMNSTMFRVKKGKDYLYFTLDGKPITDKKSLTDKTGKDPFGTQILSNEEIKAKKSSQNLNNSVNNLRNQLGF